MKHSAVLYDLQGHLLLKRYRTTPFRNKGIGNRGQISGFSPSSAARMRRYLRTCDANYRVMLTLTYPAAFPGNGPTCKDHLRRFVAAVKRYWSHECSGGEPSIFWFMEFQQRGAPHFHLFCTGELPYAWVAQTWYGIVDSGDVQHLAAGTRTEAIRSGRWGTCAYASKYAAKSEQKLVPPNFENCGRFWGVCGNRKCLSATIEFQAFDEKAEMEHKEFRTALVKLIKGHGKPLSRLHGYTRGYLITDSATVASVKALIARFGARGAINESATYEAPELGMDVLLE